MKAGKYENLAEFFMLIFKKWTASDDKDHQKLLSRWLNESISREIHLVYVVEVSVKHEKVQISCFTETSTT